MESLTTEELFNNGANGVFCLYRFPDININDFDDEFGTNHARQLDYADPPNEFRLYYPRRASTRIGPSVLMSPVPTDEDEDEDVKMFEPYPEDPVDPVTTIAPMPDHVHKTPRHNCVCNCGEVMLSRALDPAQIELATFMIRVGEYLRLPFYQRYPGVPPYSHLESALRAMAEGDGTMGVLPDGAPRHGTYRGSNEEPPFKYVDPAILSRKGGGGARAHNDAHAVAKSLRKGKKSSPKRKHPSPGKPSR